MRSIRRIGLAGLLLLLATPIAMALPPGGVVRGGIRGAMVGGMIGGSKAAKVGRTVGALPVASAGRIIGPANMRRCTVKLKPARPTVRAQPYRPVSTQISTWPRRESSSVRPSSSTHDHQQGNNHEDS